MTDEITWTTTLPLVIKLDEAETVWELGELEAMTLKRWVYVRFRGDVRGYSPRGMEVFIPPYVRLRLFVKSLFSPRSRAAIVRLD